MSEQQSKMPDFNEIVDMTTKFFSVVKTGVCEIVKDYKAKRATDPSESSAPAAAAPKAETAKPKKAATEQAPPAAETPKAEEKQL